MNEIRAALRRLLLAPQESAPFFAFIALNWKIIECDAATCRTAATDGPNLWVNPVWFAQLSLREQVGVLAHEAMHVAMAHHLRRGPRDHERWNRACDFAVNDYLHRVAGYELPKCGLLPGVGAWEWLPQGRSAEEYYMLLRDDQREESCSCDQHERQFGSNGVIGEVWDHPELESQSQEGSGSGRSGHASQCGSGTDIRATNADITNRGVGPGTDDGDTPQSSSSSMGRSEAANGRSGDGQLSPTQTSRTSEELEAELRRLLQRARQGNKGRGTVPGVSVEEVDLSQRRSPGIDWRQVLREYLRQPAQGDYCWARPNRRHVWADLYLPSRRCDEGGDMVIAIDTSASISTRMLGVFIEAINEIVGEFRMCQVWLVYCDCAIQRVEHYTCDDLPINPQDIPGRGGTSHIPVWMWLRETGLLPEVVVCLTDGDTEFGEPPGVPVVWCLTQNKTPPFGITIYVKEADHD